MNCAEFQEQVGAFALGALDPLEAAACRAHLEREGPHQGCEEALAAAERAVGKLADALPPTQPSPELWRRIEAEVRAASPAKGVASRPWASGWWAAAAALVLVLSGALAVRGQQLAREAERLASQWNLARQAEAQCRKDLAALSSGVPLQSEAVALMQRPGTKVVALEPTPSHALRAAVVFNAEEGRAVLLSNTLSPQAGRDYQLWVIRGKDAPLSAGLIRQYDRGVAVAEFDSALLRAAPADALAVSLEPAGGSPSPTEVVLVGKLQG